MHILTHIYKWVYIYPPFLGGHWAYSPDAPICLEAEGKCFMPPSVMSSVTAVCNSRVLSSSAGTRHTAREQREAKV